MVRAALSKELDRNTNTRIKKRKKSVTKSNVPEVDSPLDELRDVGRRMLTPIASRKAGASLLTSASIETKFEPEVVDLVSDGFDAARPLARIRHKLPVSITGLGRPAVINVDICFGVNTFPVQSG
jgi:hypothetical protein